MHTDSHSLLLHSSDDFPITRGHRGTGYMAARLQKLCGLLSFIFANQTLAAASISCDNGSEPQLTAGAHKNGGNRECNPSLSSPGHCPRPSKFLAGCELKCDQAWRHWLVVQRPDAAKSTTGEQQREDAQHPHEAHLSRTENGMQSGWPASVGCHCT